MIENSDAPFLNLHMRQNDLQRFVGLLAEIKSNRYRAETKSNRCA